MAFACLSVSILITIFIYRYWVASQIKTKNIPGPKRFLARRPQSQLKRWATEYGELFQVRLNAERCVFINSIEAAKFIFDKQAIRTSSKAPMPVVFKLISGSLRFFLMPKGSQWRTLRTVIQTQLTPTRSDSYYPYQEIEAKQLAFDLLTDREDDKSFYEHVKRYTMSSMMRVTYGIGIRQGDPLIHEIYGILHDFSEATFTKAYLADSFQFLCWLPNSMQWWRRSAIAQFDRQKTLWLKFWADLERRVQLQQAQECLAKRWIDVDQLSQNGKLITRDQWAFFAGTMIEAGSLSQSSALNDCLRHLAANPEIQSKAHDELVRVVGLSRSPVLADRAHCPYVRACIKEILRLVPSTSNGIAHYTTEDVAYKDYRIPRNTIVSLNLWALSHDERRYKNPEQFRPERYINLEAGARNRGKTRIQASGNDRFIWGGGRRICPGIYLADNSLFVALAKILWAFEIRPPLDHTGKKCELAMSEESYEEGRITIPRPFRLRFISQGEIFEQVIIEEYNSCCL